MTLAEMMRRVESLDLRNETIRVFEERTPEIIDMNTGQLMSGVSSNSESIQPEYYNEDYASLKQQLNPAPPKGVPDLNLTGSFHSGFRVEVKSDSLEFSSIDEKTDYITKKYSDDIFGLTKENKREFSLGYLFEDLKDYITRTTGLTFK